MIDILSDMQKANQRREFLMAKRLVLDIKTFDFMTSIYSRLLEKVLQIEVAESAEGANSIIDPHQLLIKELSHRLLSQRLFAHTVTTRRSYHDVHGSVGEPSVLFFEKLPQKSNAYIDVIFSAITNALYQYREGGLVNLYSVDKVDSRIHATRQFRRKSTLPPPRIFDMNIVAEERALYEGDYAAYPPRGENVFQLAICDYTERAKTLTAPVFTGLSGEAYVTFKFLTTFLELDQAEFILLRKALIAGFVSSHDHSLVEILDSLNFLFKDPVFSKDFKFDVSQFHINLENQTDYQEAFFTIFEDVIMDDKTVIQRNCEQFLSGILPPWFEQSIESHLYQMDQLQKDQTRLELLSIFKAIKNADHFILSYGLLEDQHEWSITMMESIVDIYCHSKYAQLPLKLLGFSSIMHGCVEPSTTTEQAKFAAELIKNFGLSSHQSGTLFDYPTLAERAELPDVPHWSEDVHRGNGAILSNKHLSPLLNIVWIMGAMMAHQDVFVVRNNDAPGEESLFSPAELFVDENNKPSMLCLELYILHVCGYTVTNIKDHGLVFIPPADQPEINPLDIFSKLSLLINMDKEQLVPYMNQLFSIDLKNPVRGAELARDGFFYRTPLLIEQGREHSHAHVQVVIN